MSETLLRVDPKVDPKAAWIKRVLLIDVFQTQARGPGLAPPPPPEPGPPHEPQGLRGRLNETGLNVRQMAHGEDGPELVRRFTEAVNAMKASDWDTVEEILDEIEPVIADGLSDARGQEAASVIRAAKAWRDACTTIAGSIEALKAHVLTVLRAEDEHTAEELADVSDELDAKLDPIVVRLNAGLADQVDAAINGSGESQAAAMETLLERITATEREFTGDSIIPIVEGNGSMPIAISAAALGALAALRKALAERVR